MSSIPVLFLLLLTATCTLGCGRRSSDNPADEYTTLSRTLASKPKMPILAPITDAPKLTKGSLQAIESKLGCQLPQDYSEFLLSSNGAFPTPDCVMFDEAGRKTASDVFCLFAIQEVSASLSLEWHRKTFSNRLPQNTLPVGRDSSGNLWLISLRGQHAGAIFFWDHGSFDTFDETDLSNWPMVAASFSQFLSRLGAYEKSVESGDMPSRYSLVRQATEGMVERDSDFTTRANPEFVWHCDCDDKGNVRMQFVQYEVHATFTHTCGYCRLCAMKGLIKGGQPRLPE